MTADLLLLFYNFSFFEPYSYTVLTFGGTVHHASLHTNEYFP